MTKEKFIVLLVIVALMASYKIAGRQKTVYEWEGRWASKQEDCVSGLQNLHISRSDLFGLGSGCRVVQPISTERNRFSFAFQCSNDDSQWSDIVRGKVSEEALYVQIGGEEPILGSSGTQRFIRCQSRKSDPLLGLDKEVRF